MGHLEQVDAKELGEVIDMVKDIEEAIYYCTITKAMEEKEKSGGERVHHHYYNRDMDRKKAACIMIITWEAFPEIPHQILVRDIILN